MTKQRIGIWIIGAWGGVSTTAAVGLTALQKGLTGTSGLVSENPFFENLNLADWDQLVIGGHEPVGVDIEPTNRRLPSALLAPRYCHDEELQWLAPYSQDTASHRQHFLQLWVRKEAVLKARGDGVHGGPRRIDAVSVPGAAVYHAPDGPPEQWKITDIKTHADYLVSVASTLDAPRPVVELLEGPCAVI